MEQELLFYFIHDPVEIVDDIEDVTVSKETISIKESVFEKNSKSCQMTF